MEIADITAERSFRCFRKITGYEVCVPVCSVRGRVHGGGDGKQSEASDEPCGLGARPKALLDTLRALPWPERRRRTRTHVESSKTVARARRCRARQSD